MREGKASGRATQERVQGEQQDIPVKERPGYPRQGAYKDSLYVGITWHGDSGEERGMVGLVDTGADWSDPSSRSPNCNQKNGENYNLLASQGRV